MNLQFTTVQRIAILLLAGVVIGLSCEMRQQTAIVGKIVTTMKKMETVMEKQQAIIEDQRQTIEKMKAGEPCESPANRSLGYFLPPRLTYPTNALLR